MVEEGAHLAAQFFDDLIAGARGLTVDEADEDESLRDGEVLQLLGVLFSDFIFGLFHQALALRLVVDVGQDGVVFLHLSPGEFGVGIHLLHVVGQTAALTCVGDLQIALHQVDVHLGQENDEGGVAVLVDAAVDHAAVALGGVGGAVEINHCRLGLGGFLLSDDLDFLLCGVAFGDHLCKSGHAHQGYQCD